MYRNQIRNQLFHLHNPKKSNKGIIAAIIIVSVIAVILLAIVIWHAGLIPGAGANSGENNNTGSIQLYYHSILHNNIYVYLDGKFMGEYPSDTYITLSSISPGTHTIRVTTTGGTYLDEKTVTVYAGETTNVELSYHG